MIAGVCRLDGCSGHEAGRMLLEKLCRMHTGQALPQIRISEGGKPYFPDSPVHFSITHTDRHAFCVLAESEVGIDAEELDRTVRPNLFPRILSASEMERVQGAADPCKAFLALWVLKEASAKCSGEGLRGIPNHTDFSPDDPRVRLWEGCLVAIVGGDPNEGVSCYAF